MITAGVLILTVNVLVLSHASALPLSPTHFPSVDSAVVRRPEGITSIFSMNDPRTGIDFFQLTKKGFQGDSQVSKIVGLRGGSATNVLSDFSNYIVDSKTRCWIVLLIAILLDTFSTMLMKMGRDESSPPKLRAAYCGYLLSLSGFSLALSSIDVSIAYAVWAALGTAIVSIAGITLFGESCDITKVICLVMIVSGVVGLNLREEH